MTKTNTDYNEGFVFNHNVLFYSLTDKRRHVVGSV